ncbi:sterile alpha motif domain-containing protein 9-like [Xenopus laevis]|uniref:Sterile alpha motif domain-containing protein 9-like n=2 Tax=Xenopus laevis TaxID=8355 RepID=A0A1L8HJ55_XENLA|nr:sterile alpha motif domain-containing protein 9-like [Xenopus laevis]OCT96124.1 hypothetical protein XELAEV_18013807mg [Xenopus laevis]
MDSQLLPLDDWTEIHVRDWLRMIRIKEEYVTRMFEEEVTGPVLKKITEKYLEKLGMKAGQIHLLLVSRDELCTQQNSTKVDQNKLQSGNSDKHPSGKEKETVERPAKGNRSESQETVPHETLPQLSPQKNKKQKGNNVSAGGPSSEGNAKHPLKMCSFREFGQEDKTFTYMKNHRLSPETGVIDLIRPCHEYKSFATAATLDKIRLQAKFSAEVFRFATACLNVRSNGTIHFGIMDSVEDKGYEHGQIVGIAITQLDWYADALNNMRECFQDPSAFAAARLCIRPPIFIEVYDKDSDTKAFVVEVDIEATLDNVKDKVFQVRLPYINNNKICYKAQATYERNGTKSEPVKVEEELGAFRQRFKEADCRRKDAESRVTSQTKDVEYLGRRLSVLITNGKQYFDGSQWYVIVTNKFGEHHLQHLKFLKHLNILCVFDFDPDSDSTGLCSKFKEFHATNMYSLESYSNECGRSKDEIISNLCLFRQTCWIFCNGRSNFLGEDQTCNEYAWIRTKGKYLNRAISFICEEIIKRASFIVLFMLMSPAEKPIAEAFFEFYREMNGLDYILCIAENKEQYEKWARLAQETCPREELEKRSIVGMQLSHIDGTVQEMMPTTDYQRTLPVSTNGLCILTVPEEERMPSLDILCVNECNNINIDQMDKEELKKLESSFYRGGKISWKHLWLAEHKQFGTVIERHGCKEVEQILKDILHKNTVKLPVARINIVHQPGSGGSTVARQILWKYKNELRCAIVNSFYSVSQVCEHVIKFRDYEEKEPIQCLPVFLLLEDCDEEYIDDLKHDLSEAMVYKKINNLKPRFILLSCKRSNDPQKLCKASYHDTVAITHKLTRKEQVMFQAKAKELSACFASELIITFVIMSHGFDKQYLKDFVAHVMHDIDHSSNVTRLIRYVALLNHYVQNSYISLSHCEEFLGIKPYLKENLQKDSQNKSKAKLKEQGQLKSSEEQPSDKGSQTTSSVSGEEKSEEGSLSQYSFVNSLNDQARLIFIELRESTTWISGIRILHPLIAEEILVQLPSTYLQSKIAMDLLEEKSLLYHRFGREDFVKFIRQLFLRRHKKSRGDIVDSVFSPLIEHVCKTENNVKMAINLLEDAYEHLDKDSLFAQQLARIHYKNEMFEEAKKWAETAKAKSPYDSFILDTEGQVYKKWFNVNLNKHQNDIPSEEAINLIGLALRSMECFRAAEKAAGSETETINNSGYFGEVDVGCRLLEFLSTLEIFSKEDKSKNTELLQYLLTDHTPEEIKKPWSRLHGQLKGLYQNIYNALKWISDEVGYFQMDKTDDGESTNRIEDHINNPRRWLLRKTKLFAKYFCNQILTSDSRTVNEFVQKMRIYQLGGGSAATILALLSDPKNERPAGKLETIIDNYPKDSKPNSLDDIDLINYTMCHIALGCVNSESSKLLPFQKLRDLCKRFLNHQKEFPPSAYFLIFMLYWPDDKFPEKYGHDILTAAGQTAGRLHNKRLKSVPVRKKRTNVHFFLGHGHGLQKFKHRSIIEKQLSGPLNERTFKWDTDQKNSVKLQTTLKKVPGWTENGKVFTKGHNSKNNIEVLPLNYSSMPHGNENITFNLGFTYIGFVAYNIQIAG